MTMTIHTLGEELSNRYRDRVAFTFRADARTRQHLTYGQLQLLSDRMADYFYRNGITKGHYIGFYCDHPLHTIIAYWACLKLGAICLPLNMEDERYYRVFDVVAPHAFFVSRTMLPFLRPHLRPNQQIFDDEETVQEAAEARQTALNSSYDHPADSDPAFIYFTSGSTGLPKGVMLSQQNIVAYTRYGGKSYTFSSSDRFLCHAAFHSDMSLFSLFLPLSFGACCQFIHPRHRWNPKHLKTIIEEEGSTSLFLVPSALRLLLLLLRQDEQLMNVRSVFLSGEKASVHEVQAAQSHFANAQFYNLYGNTECNDILAFPIPGDTSGFAELPLGIPVPYANTLLLDESFMPCPDGSVGELYVSSPTMMLGYYGHRLHETSTFITVPGHPGAFFPTKDLMRCIDGVYYYVSRRDNMVKVNGQRVYLSMVESIIKQLPQVSEVAVIATTRNNRLQLSAAIYGADIAIPLLRKHCSDNLPSYAVPRSYELHVLPLPKTTTGKIDYETLKQRLE
ncbi:AMP-binding protein [Paenibacillus sp. SYP-B4298]|uniref:AMP-binding protein n=1 Tax=Paenibacillus sp. SYP-B4298 TaxID=2996034 RepID=UPI0022DD6FA1|nr:AMP-binding protein [Paenibacillus sp. SYP-B4298]